MDEEIFMIKIRKILAIALIYSLMSVTSYATSLEDIRQQGVLRHLAIPYANFVRDTKNGTDGLDVELMQLFAKHLGVRYELVRTTWGEVFGDLTGELVQAEGDDVKVIGTTNVKGDIVANGLTVFPHRQKIVDYSIPTFPTGVWLVARSDSSIKPIEPSGDIDKDIQQVKVKLSGYSVLSMKGTCLDPDLYDLASTGAYIRYHTASQNLNDIAPAVIIEGVAETTLLDIPDALIALQKWPGEIKIVGPVSSHQTMGVAVAKNSPELLHEFNQFFKACWKDGTYKRLVEKYYPSVFLYLNDFFENDLGE